MLRSSFALSALLFVSSTTALAENVKKEFNDPSSADTYDVSLADTLRQSFTATSDYHLCEVDVALNFTETSSFRIIVFAQDGLTELGRVDTDPSTTTDPNNPQRVSGTHWVCAHFSPILITSGQTYFIAVSSLTCGGSGPCVWVHGADYSGGSATDNGSAVQISGSDSDFIFENYATCTGSCCGCKCNAGTGQCGDSILHLLPGGPIATLSSPDDLLTPGPHVVTLESFDGSGLLGDAPYTSVQLPTSVPVSASLVIEKVNTPSAPPTTSLYRVQSGTAMVGSLSPSDFPQYSLPSIITGTNTLQVVPAESYVYFSRRDGVTSVDATLVCLLTNNVFRPAAPMHVQLRANGTYDSTTRRTLILGSHWRTLESSIVLGSVVPAIGELGLCLVAISIGALAVWVLRRGGSPSSAGPM